MNQKIFSLISSIIISIVTVLIYSIYGDKESPKIIVMEVIEKDSLKFLTQTPEEGLMGALQYYGISHPEVVYAQAMLETANFKSGICTNNNNLFGLYDSKNNKYYSYNHWSESVKEYKDKVQYKYNDNYDPHKEYYRFLVNIKYAEDPDYINKIKNLIDSNSISNDKRRSP